MSSTQHFLAANSSLLTMDEPNSTAPLATEACSSVHDMSVNKTVRLLVLILTIVLNIVGSTLVVLWILCNRQGGSRLPRVSRVDAFILHLTVADALVIALAVLPQVLWEYADRDWMVGPVLCRLVKFTQSFSIMSSNFMLVVIAVDRHQAICAPLKKARSVWMMTGAGWMLAMVFSTPVMGIFHLNSEDGVLKCENIFRYRPLWHRQVWVTFVAVVVFFIPLALLAVCYLRIFIKISTKEAERHSHRRASLLSSDLHGQSSRWKSLQKAKLKSLKMTFVIIVVFVVCTVPYFVVEMIMSYGGHCLISKTLYGLLGGMAACNSACNPFVFLMFNVRKNCFTELMKHNGNDKWESSGWYMAKRGSISATLYAQNNARRHGSSVSFDPSVHRCSVDSFNILSHRDSVETHVL